jgi:hypothetical protein
VLLFYYDIAGGLMWKKRKHKEFMYFWINEKKGLSAGLSSTGKFTLWSDKGHRDTVQCETVNEVLAIMKTASRPTVLVAEADVKNE